MTTSEDRSYWTRACHFFRDTGFAESAGSYFLHNKNAETVRIGIRCQAAVSVRDGYFGYTADGRTTTASWRAGDPVFPRVQQLLSRDAPFFFLVSPDLRRRYVDRGLPVVRFVQPVIEFMFSPDHGDGCVSYAQDVARQQQGEDMLRACAAHPLPGRPEDHGEAGPFAELAAGWVPAEDDDSFVRRLAEAIGVLQGHPDGKMTLTRAYEHRLAVRHSPFDLYELHARMNGEYACSHFCCIRDGVFSLGVTPENVFELSGRTLTVDVVAATCKSSDSEEYLATELYENPKQVKEHTSSLANRQNRFRPFCAAGSIRVVQDMRTKVLRNVCHLHSVFTAELLPEVTVFDLMENIFPLLGARPKELLTLADAEPAPHRYYGGLVGHLHRGTGGGFLNIRNALLNDDVIHAKVGVGLIKESDPHSELVETRDKLSGLLEAVRLWERSDPRDSAVQSE